MEAKVLNIQRSDYVNPRVFPDGIYGGEWGGYIVKVNIKGINYMMATDIGIRTANVKCLVEIKAGTVTVKTIE